MQRDLFSWANFSQNFWKRIKHRIDFEIIIWLFEQSNKSENKKKKKLHNSNTSTYAWEKYEVECLLCIAWTKEETKRMERNWEKFQITNEERIRRNENEKKKKSKDK